MTLAMTGKNTRTAAIIAFESGLRTPNQLLKRGAKAMIGTAPAATATGSRTPRAVDQRDDANATTTPTTVPMTRPPIASRSVAAAEVSSAKRVPSSQFSPSAAMIAEGWGRMNALSASAPTMSSQPTRTNTKTPSGGTRSTTRRLQRPPAPIAPVPMPAVAAVTRSRPLLGRDLATRYPRRPSGPARHRRHAAPRARR